ncbi:MAG: hypothetical protein Q8K59_09245 [Nitrosomonas sp.]|nr:hypothetical protein [Nitrosomonas sp.]MDP1951260.1 hypothetical protein [Nitrosomonas sp.]
MKEETTRKNEKAKYPNAEVTRLCVEIAELRKRVIALEDANDYAADDDYELERRVQILETDVAYLSDD